MKRAITYRVAVGWAVGLLACGGTDKDTESVAQGIGTQSVNALTNGPSIKGTYEMTATGSCLHSPAGFDGSDPLVPKGPTFAATTMARATWKFDGRGKATFWGENFATILPGGTMEVGLERKTPIGSSETPWVFSYTVDRSGFIEGTVENISTSAGHLTLQGRMSKDHKTISLTNAGQVQQTSAGPAICNTARMLFAVDD